MSENYRNHIFWGRTSPLSSLFCVGLLAMASSRFAYALTTGLCLLFVYCAAALVAAGARPILPQRGRPVIYLFLSSFLGSLYLFGLSLFSPLLAQHLLFVIILVPCTVIASGIFDRLRELELVEGAALSFQEAGIIALLMLALSLIREPIGFATLSFPGGAAGIIELFNASKTDFFPAQVFAASAGAFLLIGLGLVIYGYNRAPLFNGRTGE
ncbi:hypothetical protein ACYULU_05185 [Breznakiellaceae bacterium SP9]